MDLKYSIFSFSGSRMTSSILNYFRFIFLLFIPSLSFSQVQVAGEMRSIMQLNDLSATVDLDSLQPAGLYALGVAEGLKGEIIILNGKGYITSLVSGIPSTRSASKVRGAMVVFDHIPSWKITQHQDAIQNLNELEKFLEHHIQQTERQAGEPFAFLLTTSTSKVTYHVIDWVSGASHSAASHKQFALKGELSNQPVTILGFYSNRHQGVFTHHDSKIHLHVITENKDLVGHVDQLELKEGFSLSLE